MKVIGKLYQKYRNCIENGVFIVVLALYPLTRIHQGLDVADTTYSLANFRFFPSASGTWMVATYLANVAGYLLMQLPKGDTLAGMYFYTAPSVSALALIFYLTLRKKMPAGIVFLGEFLAISLCWCPTTILYNYLTYLLMGAGILLLYEGIGLTRGKKRNRYLFLAGVCLGANVAVRMPNVVQAVFILALWYGNLMEKEKLSDTWKDTLWCIAGYLAGFGIPFVAICVQYGWNAYPEMVRNMFAMTEKAKDYKPASMLTGMLEDYRKGLYWLVFAGVCLAGLYLLYCLLGLHGRKFADTKTGVRLCGIVCAAVSCVLVRFYWGRGMFDLCYYNYLSVYYWAVLFLLVTIVCAVSLLIDRAGKKQEKTLALLVLLEMFVTPLGSNNGLYPMVNNLFLAAPFTIWVCYRWFAETEKKSVHIPWKCMAAVFGAVLLVQSVGFHSQFVFSDGVWGEKRDTLLTGFPRTEGIYTTRENAELFLDLAAFADERQFAGREVILYGEIPGLGYLLDMPAAISTFWPDLDSYRTVQMEQDMEQVAQNIEEKRPVVIVSSAIAAYRGEDAKAYQWFDVDVAAYDADEKLGMLLRFLDEYQYEETFCNMRYAVYE